MGCQVLSSCLRLLMASIVSLRVRTVIQAFAPSTPQLFHPSIARARMVWAAKEATMRKQPAEERVLPLLKDGLGHCCVGRTPGHPPRAGIRSRGPARRTRRRGGKLGARRTRGRRNPGGGSGRGVPGNDDPGGSISLQSSHGSKSGFEASVVGLYGVVGMDLCVMQGRRQQFVEDAGLDPVPVGGDLGRRDPSSIARAKNRRAASLFRRGERNTSMTWPNVLPRATLTERPARVPRLALSNKGRRQRG